MTTAIHPNLNQCRFWANVSHMAGSWLATSPLKEKKKKHTCVRGVCVHFCVGGKLCVFMWVALVNNHAANEPAVVTMVP